MTKQQDHIGSSQVRALSPSATPMEAVTLHWREYIMEGAELGMFMLAASSFGTALFYVGSPFMRLLPNATLRLILMGIFMGTTAISIIRSPMGRRSGAHFNPAVSITFFCLGRMHRLDAIFYVIAQFVGGACGVLVARLMIGARLAAPSVCYVVTVPGRHGLLAAFLAEYFMGWLMMMVVLVSANSPRLARFTWLLVGTLVMIYVIVFSGISGFSVNPARTVASAIFAGVWTALWIYLAAPLLGMLSAAALYILHSGSDAVLCAKLYHDQKSPCPFYCRFRATIPLSSCPART
jgi:aquaporin Z